MITKAAVLLPILWPCGKFRNLFFINDCPSPFLLFNKLARMHNYRPAMKMEKNFRPEGASSAVGDVITAGAGEQFRDVYKFVHKNGYRIVGGGSRTVGFAGGYLAGGGHSVLSNELGEYMHTVYYIRYVCLLRNLRIGCRQCTAD